MRHAETKSTDGAEKLREEFEALVADAKRLMDATAGEAGEKAREARERLAVRIDEAKAALGKAEDAFSASLDKAGDYVREKPWHALGAAAGIGLILGLLLGRK
jgi:ElaB/YqjD/DUF883 family membrane-anchored ribosome-binding protein